MSVVISQNDPKFKDEILAVALGLREEGKTMTTTLIVKEMASFIATTFANEKRGVFKSIWINRILSACRLGEIELTNDKADFTPVFSLIQSIPSTPSTSAASSSSSDSVCSSTTSTSTTISKQTQLTEADLAIVNKIYSSLDEDKMWKLSSDKIVEKEMAKFAAQCTVEHPAHSLILDLSDPTWNKYFTQEEINEMITHNAKQLPQLSQRVQDQLDALRSIEDPNSLYEHLIGSKVNAKTDPTHEWIVTSLINCFKLFIFNHVPISDLTESNILNRVRNFVETAFDGSKINCRTGEKSSTSSSSDLNQNRTIGGVDNMQRKMTGRKIDMIFKTSSTEFGFAEASRYEDHTKQLLDGSFKMPKVMKNMFTNICNSLPSTVNEMSIPGFLIMRSNLTYKILDIPTGYVCRVNSLPLFNYPDMQEQITTHFIPLLELILQTKLLMENNLALTQTRLRENRRVNVIGVQTPVIPSCFNPQRTSKQKTTSNKITPQKRKSSSSTRDSSSTPSSSTSHSSSAE